MPVMSQDLMFLSQCDLEKAHSHDPDRKVGVVITNSHGIVLATGTNRPPSPLNLTPQQSHVEILNDSQWKYYVLEHAERNAINDARNKGLALDGATLYGSLFPCADCARAIISAGITRVVFPISTYESNRDEKWQEHYFYARKIFELAGTKLDFLPMQTSPSSTKDNNN